MLYECIGYHEIEKTVKKLKIKKSSGIDGLPNEVLTDPSLLVPLRSLLNKCFDWGLILCVWQEPLYHQFQNFE